MLCFIITVDIRFVYFVISFILPKSVKLLVNGVTKEDIIFLILSIFIIHVVHAIVWIMNCVVEPAIKKVTMNLVNTVQIFVADVIV